MLRKLAVMAGWAGAAFAVQTAFAMALVWGPDVYVVAAYGVALATTFALHRATRGPLMFLVAFGLGWALFVEAAAFSVGADDFALPKRATIALLLALPLVAFVVRRFATDAEDAWFRRHARRAVSLSLVVALPLLVAGAIGSWKADPKPYGDALRALRDGRCGGYFLSFLSGVDRAPGSPCYAEHERRWAAFSAESSHVERKVRGEVVEACGRFGTSDATRAIDCADELVSVRLRAATKRRDDFRIVALAASVPLGIALLFAWRGRRERLAAS